VATFLLTWNPDIFHWDEPGDSLAEQIAAIAARGFVDDRWGCGFSRGIRAGDRLFLMRLGVEPRGIVGSGHALGSPYTAPHWQIPGKLALCIDVRFDHLRDATRDPILPIDLLRHDPRFESMRTWTPRASGAHIPDDTARELELAWQDLRAKTTS
jgi:5-methylcytosine-specific restriction protein A